MWVLTSNFSRFLDRRSFLYSPLPPVHFSVLNKWCILICWFFEELWRNKTRLTKIFKSYEINCHWNKNVLDVSEHNMTISDKVKICMLVTKLWYHVRVSSGEKLTCVQEGIRKGIQGGLIFKSKIIDLT